jgi:hypothetical protein
VCCSLTTREIGRALDLPLALQAILKPPELTLVTTACPGKLLSHMGQILLYAPRELLAAEVAIESIGSSLSPSTASCSPIPWLNVWEQGTPQGRNKGTSQGRNKVANDYAESPVSPSAGPHSPFPPPISVASVWEQGTTKGRSDKMEYPEEGVS